MCWSGTVASIPPGWKLCDGTAGTPDLRNRFIIAAGDTFDPGDAGGSNTHTHNFTSDGHFHTWTAGYLFATGTTWDDVTDAKTDSGTTDPADHRPQYYALAYIMKE